MQKSTLDYLDSLVLLLLEPGQDMRLKAFLDQRNIPLEEFKNQSPEEQEKQLEAIIREHKEKA